MLSRFRLKGILSIILSSVVTLTLYVFSKPADFAWGSNGLRVLSQVLALLGTLFLSLTFILSSRVNLIEKIFGGLDIVYKLHHILGALSFVMLLHHPLVLAVQQLPNLSIAKSYLVPGMDVGRNMGIFALGLMILLIIFTMFVKLPYHIWKHTHTWMGGVLFLSMFHVFLINSDISNFRPLQIWMLFWLSSAVISFLLKSFGYRWYADSYEYLVDSVSELDSTLKIILTPKTEKRFNFVPGQFVFFEVIGDSRIGAESHPFSIASSPNEKNITLYCKKTGDYVDRLLLLNRGAKVNINGPYGTFLERALTSKYIVGIAGGVGFTPFLSLVNYLRDNSTHTKISLFHTVNDVIESPFLLEKNLSNISINVHDSYKEGRLTASKIIEQLPVWKDATFFICGPLGMMNEMRQDLLNCGVRPSRVIFEDFGFK